MTLISLLLLCHNIVCNWINLHNNCFFRKTSPYRFLFPVTSVNIICSALSCFRLCPSRCLIKDFELRPNVFDLLQHVFIRQIVGREKTLQKQLMELIDLNQQIGVIEKTRYSRKSQRLLNQLLWFCESVFYFAQKLDHDMFKSAWSHENS